MGQIIQGRRRLKRQQFIESGTFTVPAGVTSIQYLLASGGTSDIASSGARETGVMPVTPGQTLPVVVGGVAGNSYLAHVGAILRHHVSSIDPQIGDQVYVDAGHFISRKINDEWKLFASFNTGGYCEIFWEE